MRLRYLASALGAAIAALAPAASGQQARPSSVPGAANFGTTAISYYRVGAVEFQPDSNDQAFTTTWADPPGAAYLRYPDVGLPEEFFAMLHLPDGVRLRSLELDDCDYNAEDQHLVLELWDCDYLGSCGDAPLASVSSANNANGFQCGFAGADLSGLNYTVNDNYRQLLLKAFFNAGDGTNQIAGAILGYSLQVSPAPATPSFGDVATTDFAFQYIEALSKSGITGGCQAAPALFCPDAPLTRRQMAIFLAKALGLQWP